MSGVVLLILILGFASNLSVALECYTCVGLTNCQSEFEGIKRECSNSSDSQRCYVSRTEVDEKVTSYSRGCIDATECDDGCEETSLLVLKTTVCQECCDSDLCNTGNTGVLFTPIIHLLVAATVVALAISAIMSE
ncbi:ly6/PLAUR domain-containing protein 2-like [Ptychodera flava]|uniref:ly6/PLAUR domain-containing protein 2-like n=1 Tax=Ptychodera flava TaxID=63121 RepID=UPI00396A44D1